MQRVRHGIEIVVEQIGIGVERDLRRLVPEHPLKRQDIDPSRDGQRRAGVPQIVRRDLLHGRALTAPANHPRCDFGRGR